MSKVQSLPPTYGIQDPQVRAFCDALTNAWQLRNGNIGHDDSQRFITKEEWAVIANNPTIKALANVGQPGVNGSADAGGTDGGTNEYLPPGVQQLINLINTPITLTDVNRILRTNNELLGTVLAARDYALGEIDKLKNGITDITIIDPATGAAIGTLRAVKSTTSSNQAAILEINNVSTTSTSAAAQRLAYLGASVGYDPVTHQAQATADIVELNKVDAVAYPGGSTSANATMVRGLYANVSGPSGALALIGEINKVDVTSTSASAQRVQTLMAAAGLKGRVIVFAATTSNSYPNRAAYGPPNPYPAAGTVGSTSLVLEDMWLDSGDTAVPYRLYRWRGSPAAWVVADAQDLAQAIAGATSEVVARSQKDLALASAINNIWAKIGGNTAVIEDGALASATATAATASKWSAVESALKDDNGNVVAAAIRSEFNTYVNKATGGVDAAWTLRVNTQSNGTKTVAGLGLYVNGASGTSSFAVETDHFGVWNPTTSATDPVFSVSGGYTRMKVALIDNYIASDNFNGTVSSGTITANGSAGWCVAKNGKAVFQDIYARGNIEASTIIADSIDTANLKGYAVSVTDSDVSSDCYNDNPQVTVNDNSTGSTIIHALIEVPAGVAEGYVNTFYLEQQNSSWDLLDTITVTSASDGSGGSVKSKSTVLWRGSAQGNKSYRVRMAAGSGTVRVVLVGTAIKK